MTSKLSERMRYLMKRRGNLTEIELARAAGLPQPTVHHILAGTTARPHRKSLLALAQALSVSIDDLLDEISLNELDKKLEKQPLKLIPLITWEEAITYSSSQHNATTANNVAHNKMIFTDVPISEDAFALIVKDSSMEALFPLGTLLIVDPHKQARDKSYVIVHLHGQHEAVFKQALFDGTQCYLKSLNPHLNKVDPFSLRPQDRIVGVAVQTRLNFD